MASSRLPERAVPEEPFCAHKYSLLIITGPISHPDQAGLIHREIERGVRSWDVSLRSCNLSLYLQEFLTHHIVSLKGPGHRCLRHSTSVLDTQVLISPAQEQVHSEVCSLLDSDSAHKLLVLAGQSVEETGGLLLHKGLFSSQHLRSILTEQLSDRGSSPFSRRRSSRYTLTLSCPNVGTWRDTFSGSQPPGHPTLSINPPEVLPAMEALGEFTSLVTGSLHPSSPFEVLPPPGTVGFLKLSRPCCYVFPAGRGDCAFFAVNGFTMLLDGGSDAQACFWKLVRHLDRVDALLVSHISTSSLAGVNTFLERKVAEMELGGPDGKDDLTKRLISPELGVVFFNAPCSLHTDQQPSVDSVLKSADQATLTIRLLKKLEIVPQPMFRPAGVPIEPMTLFQKMGVGQLELYILHPGKASPEYQALMQSWPDRSNPSSQTRALPLPAMTSVCALLVWHPACPQEKVVRVLFPGATPQGKLLEGLEKLRGLAFLQKPTVTTGDLEVQKEHKQAKRTASQDSVKEVPPRVGKEEAKEGLAKEKAKVVNGSALKEEGKKEPEKNKVRNGNVKPKSATTEKNVVKKGGGRDVKKDKEAGKIEDSGPKRREQGKKEVPPSKPKNENKAKPKKEAKKDTKTLGKKPNKPSGKEIKTGSNLMAKKASLNNELQKTESAPSNTEELSRTLKAESPAEEPKRDNPSDQNHSGSRRSTPEDITEDLLKLRGESVREVTISEVGHDSEIIGVQIGESETKMLVLDQDRAVTSLTGKGPAEVTAEKLAKAVRVEGFPGPLNMCSQSDQTDLTPTEYTLLDGALKSSPPSGSSGDNPATASPDEATVGHTSSESRANSAGHTPYCLSPDDVWCNRDKLSRLQGQMARSDDPTDALQPPVPPVSAVDGQQGEGQTTFNPREKTLTTLSLGTFKESAGPDPSTSVTTTTTTHSMPAEAISPQSTEVDESLSMSYEKGSIAVSQRDGEDSLHHSVSNGSHCVDTEFRVGMSLPLKKPPRSLGQGLDMGRPPGHGNLHFESEAHDVDLCLVSPCEFKHFKPTDPASTAGDRHEGNAVVAGPQHHGNNNSQRDMSLSESNAPHCTEDCPSTTADGGLDSDEDESCSEPTSSLNDPHAHQNLPPDPPPAPLRDGPPPPPQPDSCMPVPQSDPEVHGRGAKTAGTRGKKYTGVSEASLRAGPTGGSAQGGKSRVVGGLGGGLGRGPPRTSGTKTTPAKASASPEPGQPGCEGPLSVHVDLAYLPSGASSATVDVDFFTRVLSSCYIISGDGPEREELMRPTLDALLDGKATWREAAQVTVIPTFESAAMQAWYQQTVERQKELDVVVLGSNSTVAMQDETFPACKIEF
ncbi:microtubule-associated protein 1S-like [Gadus macrocephalus]|uniref:microtubule-associated protein 1S-like n=1 Tax=Gadus macrocephalus TaxID=80720 RepID=UPI0028CB6327|nr:microtubule-associated protein 1S-like [Gadus macrocephalus]